MSLRPLPHQHQRLPPDDPEEHDALTLEYYLTLSRPQSALIATRPTSCSAVGAPLHSPQVPPVVRSVTPFHSLRRSATPSRILPISNGTDTRPPQPLNRPKSPQLTPIPSSIPQLASVNDSINDLGAFLPVTSKRSGSPLSDRRRNSSAADSPQEPSRGRLTCLIGDRATLANDPRRGRSANLYAKIPSMNSGSSPVIPPSKQPERAFLNLSLQAVGLGYSQLRHTARDAASSGNAIGEAIAARLGIRMLDSTAVRLNKLLRSHSSHDDTRPTFIKNSPSRTLRYIEI